MATATHADSRDGTYARDERYAHDATTTHPRRMSWGAVIAGAIGATAVFALLMMLGLGIGATALEPMQADSGSVLGSSIYLFVAQLVALAVGGFAAAKLAGIPSTLASALHGFLVWAVTTILTLVLAAMGVGALVGGAASMVTSAAGTAQNAGQAVIPNDISLPSMNVNQLPQPVQRQIEERNLDPQQIQNALGDALGNVISQQERQRARELVTRTARDAVTSPGDAASELQSLMDKLYGGGDAVISQEDRQEVVNQVTQNTELDEQQVNSLVDTWQSEAQQAVEQSRQALQQAQEQATQAANTATDTLAATGWAAFIGSIIGLIAATLAGMLGKARREETVARS